MSTDLLSINSEAPPTAVQSGLITKEAFEQELNSIDGLLGNFEQHSIARGPMVLASIVALLLLAVWAITSIRLVQVTQGIIPSAELSDVLVQASTVVGALVSALLVAVLTASDPKQNPALQRPSTVSETSQRNLAHEICSRYSYLHNNLKKDLAGGSHHADQETQVPHGYENVAARMSTLLTRVERISRYYPDPILNNFLQPRALQRLIINPLNSWLSSLYLWVVSTYAVVWLVVSITVVSVAWFDKPGVNETLQTMAMTQIGIAIAAAYAYFGIKPPSASSG